MTIPPPPPDLELTGPWAVVPSPEISRRDQLAGLCNARGLICHRALEVGVDCGAFALAFLRAWRGGQMVLCDPWEPYDERPWDRSGDLATAVGSLTAAGLGHRYRVARCTRQQLSDSGALAAQGPYAFAYVDALHDHAAVAADIQAIWPHIVPGGILAGHDFCPRQFPGVVAAVREFAAARNLAVYVTREPLPSWYCYRPPAPRLRHTEVWLEEYHRLAELPRHGRPILSLLVPSLKARSPTFRRLRRQLGRQIAALPGGPRQVEVLTAVDAGGQTLADKRQSLLDRATGAYVAFLDDDDEIGGGYLRRILGAILDWPGVDVVTFEGERTVAGKPAETRRQHWSLATRANRRTPTTRYIMANHLCPMRTELARRSRFWRPLPYGSDQLWWRALHIAGLLVTEVHLDERLYAYRWSAAATATQQPGHVQATRQAGEHRLFRLREDWIGMRAGTLLYDAGDGDGWPRQLLAANGRRVEMPEAAVEDLGTMRIP